MAKKEKILFHPDSNLIEVDGKFFKYKNVKYKKIGKVTHEDVHVWEEVSLEEIDKLRKSVVDKLKKHIKPERVIEEVLKDAPIKTLEKMKKELNQKGVKVKPHDGCYGLEIDTGKKRSRYFTIFD